MPDPTKRAIIFQFQQIGTSVKTIAVDEATGIEVSVIAPSSAARFDLQRLATAKLMRALERTRTKS